jgi:chemotaxis protein CheX
MNTGTAIATAKEQEDWLPILELAIKEVFEIMLGSQVQPKADPEFKMAHGEFTAMVGLAGALCGVLTVCCNAQTAGGIAKSMLGDTAENEEQVADALGEICNMIAGNFKNKLAGTDERCMLSVPSVITGGEYVFRSLADGTCLETILRFKEAPVVVRLQLHS